MAKPAKRFVVLDEHNSSSNPMTLTEAIAYAKRCASDEGETHMVAEILGEAKVVKPPVEYKKL